MKIQKIFVPIIVALIIGACSASGNNNRNNNSAGVGGSNNGSGGGGTTNPPEENLDLGLERAELSFYTSLLDGDLLTRLDSVLGDTTRGTLKYQRESANEGFFGFLAPDGLDGTPMQATVTNDIVERIYITNDDTFLRLFQTAVQTRRGGVAGDVPQKFWRNNITAKIINRAFLRPVSPRPTIFAGATGDEEAMIDSDFALYATGLRSATGAIVQTNIGRTERLSGFSLLLPVANVLPSFTTDGTGLAILIRTNATGLDYYELATSGDASSLDSLRYFLKEDDKGIIRYQLVE